jgi:hypothetical protein
LQRFNGLAALSAIRSHHKFCQSLFSQILKTMSKPQAKNSPAKAGGSPSSAVKKGAIVNKYAIGYSPKKPIKQEIKASQKSSHMFYLCSIRGGFFEVAYLNHGRNCHDDGYYPHTVNLVRGGGTFLDKNNRVQSDERLVQHGFLNCYFRRGPDGEILTNITVSRGLTWNRRLLLKCNTPEDAINGGRTDEQMIDTLATLCRVTVDLNARIDLNSRVTNDYAYAQPVHEKNPVDGEDVSLDHYLLDRDVVEVLEGNCDILGPTFAVDYPEVASVYFDPYRATYPPEVHKYGWVDSATQHGIGNQNSGNIENDLERFRGEN